MPEPQAETVTDLVKEAQDSAAGDLATKADMAVLRSELRELEPRMTVKLGGMLALGVGDILAAIRYLPPGH